MSSPPGDGEKKSLVCLVAPYEGSISQRFLYTDGESCRFNAYPLLTLYFVDWGWVDVGLVIGFLLKMLVWEGKADLLNIYVAPFLYAYDYFGESSNGISAMISFVGLSGLI